MAADFLEKILAEKRRLNTEKRAFFKSIKENFGKVQYTRYRLFERIISKPGEIHLIAEIKKASPSQGILREDFNVLEIAKTYVEHKAAAISVLSEEKFFFGKSAYVKKVSENFNVPVLTKDFIIDEGQVFEARYNGSSAILLIMAILNDKDCAGLMKLADSLDLDCLIEVHDEQELNRALALDARIVGINNRDLASFKVDLKTSEELIPKIPKGKVIVAESGIKTHQDVKTLQKLGAHAVLIGEAFMREKDIGKKIEEIMRGA